MAAGHCTRYHVHHHSDGFQHEGLDWSCGTVGTGWMCESSTGLFDGHCEGRLPPRNQWLTIVMSSIQIRVNDEESHE